MRVSTRTTHTHSLHNCAPGRAAQINYHSGAHSGIGWEHEICTEREDKVGQTLKAALENGYVSQELAAVSTLRFVSLWRDSAGWQGESLSLANYPMGC